eukprot:12571580-Alexandrium_andersonii.AAC.1
MSDKASPGLLRCASTQSLTGAQGRGRQQTPPGQGPWTTMRARALSQRTKHKDWGDVGCNETGRANIRR